VQVQREQVAAGDAHAHPGTSADDAAVDEAEAEEAAQGAGPLTLAIDMSDGAVEPAAVATP
jgi:hypothetical protein